MRTHIDWIAHENQQKDNENQNFQHDRATDDIHEHSLKLSGTNATAITAKQLKIFVPHKSYSSDGR